jgi:multiple sugar transport system permease protein
MKTNRLTPYLFLTPFMLAFSLFFILPVLYSVYLSFLTRVRRGFSPPTEVFGGFTNYIRAFTDTDFLTSFLNIVVFGLIQVPIMLAVATLFALIIDEASGFLTKFFRTAIYIPYTIPGVIAGLLWGFLYSRNLSPLNFALISGGNEPVDFLGSIGMLLFSVGNIVTWTWTGYNAITLYANLQSVSRDLYEAAAIDGATGWNVIRYIKLPLLRPALMLTLVFSVIGTAQIFSEPFVLRAIGFVPDSITPNTYIYKIASVDANYYYAAALAVVLALVTFSSSAVFLRYVNRSQNV